MPEPDEPLRLLRKILPFTTVAVVIAAIYVGWIFYSRSRATSQAESERSQKETAAARRTVELMGGGRFKILHFYAVPGAIKRGDHATVCFGVSEAKSVRIEPEIEPIHPALSHCLQVSPKKDTLYTLTAEDGKGHTATESFTLQVVR